MSVTYPNISKSRPLKFVAHGLGFSTKSAKLVNLGDNITIWVKKDNLNILTLF